MTEGQTREKGSPGVAFREAPEDPFPLVRGAAFAGEIGKDHGGDGVKDPGEIQLQKHAVDLAGFFINILQSEDLSGPVREPLGAAQTGKNRQIYRHKIACDGRNDG